MDCDIWNYLIEIGRPDKAEAFFRKNRNLDKLREQYVEYKLETGRLDEGWQQLMKACCWLRNKSNSGQ